MFRTSDTSHFWTFDMFRTSDIFPMLYLARLGDLQYWFELPLSFGRPKHRTSEMQRTSDISFPRLCAQSEENYKSDTDLRQLSDVRHVGRPNHVGIMSDVRYSIYGYVLPLSC